METKRSLCTFDMTTLGTQFFLSAAAFEVKRSGYENMLVINFNDNSTLTFKPPRQTQYEECVSFYVDNQLSID